MNAMKLVGCRERAALRKTRMIEPQISWPRMAKRRVQVIDAGVRCRLYVKQDKQEKLKQEVYIPWDMCQ